MLSHHNQPAGTSGAKSGDFLSGMSTEDARSYLEWNNLVSKGFNAEEHYSLFKFCSIKT